MRRIVLTLALTRNSARNGGKFFACPSHAVTKALAPLVCKATPCLVSRLIGAK